MGLAAAPLTLSSASPALAQSTAPVWGGAAPLGLALGLGGLAFMVMVAVLAFGRREREAVRRSAEQIAALRAEIDAYEALHAGLREVTLIWTAGTTEPKVLGQVGAVLPGARHPEALLDFHTWLAESEAENLMTALAGLRSRGQPFELSLLARDRRTVQAYGWVLGMGVALRLRPRQSRVGDAVHAPALPMLEPVLSRLVEPAAFRADGGMLAFVNAAWLQVGRLSGREAPAGGLLDLADKAGPVEAGIARLELAPGLSFDRLAIPVPGGVVDLLRPLGPARADLAVPGRQAELDHMAGIVDAIAAPVAVFNAKRELVHCNRAYSEFWGLDADFLAPGTDEGTILDRLRTEGLLPSETDYRAWRAEHLKSYKLTMPREQQWHLPDRRTINVVSAPAGPSGGVIYVFEDMSERLQLESRNRALSSVQRSTLNALSEGVAVFGTNGRLTLYNPRLSGLWALPANELAASPHIDLVAESAAAAFPEDGAAIWSDLKRRVVDLNPNRVDQRGRITRSDGRLIDYAVTRLPDGQTMLTFVDVTESADYSRLLKERNDALVTADRLKDAFVQNVSYELRSPLTNIIGFADLLASGAAGKLTSKQKDYTDYIRASSATLGVLVDNILDLATVDAGIAQLQPELQDVAALIDKARAGLTATFPPLAGEKPLNLKVEIAPDLPAFHADGTRIVQVLYNLLSNAARFSEPGAEIRLAVTARGRDRIVFAVEDRGTGMSEDTAAAFTGVEAAMGGRQRAAGLGLAIVKTFVNLHGGTIAVEALRPRGTRVIVNLPARPAGTASSAADAR